MTDYQARMLAVSYARYLGIAGLLLALVIAGLTVGRHLARANDTTMAVITEVEPLGDTITDPKSGDGYALEITVPGGPAGTAYVGPGSYHRGGTVRVYRQGTHWVDYRLNTDALTAAGIIAGWAVIIIGLDLLLRGSRRRRTTSTPVTPRRVAAPLPPLRPRPARPAPLDTGSAPDVMDSYEESSGPNIAPIGAESSWLPEPETPHSNIRPTIEASGSPEAARTDVTPPDQPVPPIVDPGSLPLPPTHTEL